MALAEHLRYMLHKSWEIKDKIKKGNGPNGSVENPDKINGLFGDEGVLGSYLIRFLPLFLACLLTIFRTKNKYLFIIVSDIFISILQNVCNLDIR